MDKVFGIILKVSYENMGNTYDMELFGKTMGEWVSLSLDGAPFAAIDYRDDLEITAQVRDFLRTEYEYTAVLFSDAPLITKKTLAKAVSELADSGANVLKMTRGYIFKTNFLQYAQKLYTDNTRYYDEEDFVTAFNLRQLGMVSEMMRMRILNYHMDRGVRFTDVCSARVDADVMIERGVIVGENNILKGKTVIKEGAKLLYNNVIEDGIIDEGCEINSSRLYHCYIGSRTKVGPFAYIRPETVIGSDCRIGDFVEIKKSVIGKGCKVSHLSYVGDCEMGEDCNIGCGVVFVNYDGKNKFKSKVGNRVFVGSNSNIIAPVVLSDNSFVAAGSTLTNDVPPSALAIARARQVVKPEWSGNAFAKKFEQSDKA